METQIGKLNEMTVDEYIRPNGTRAVRYGFENCPTLAEQHTAHLTDINYLMEKYKPDELSRYLAARNQYRQEIVGHDFAQEPNLQQAMDIRYRLRKEYDELPDDIKNHFGNHVEFLKFIDNPANQEKMLKLGILKQKQIDKLTGADLSTDPAAQKTNDKPNDDKK